MINLWNLHIPPNCSWLFRGIYRVADDIKACIWLQSTNPSMVSFLYDPWCFETPLAFKPTFLNMHLDFERVRVVDFIHNNVYDSQKFLAVFGIDANPLALSHGNITPCDPSQWVWFSKINSKSVTATFYNFHYGRHSYHENWNGWTMLWKLKVSLQGSCSLIGYSYMARLKLMTISMP